MIDTWWSDIDLIEYNGHSLHEIGLEKVNGNMRYFVAKIVFFHVGKQLKSNYTNILLCVYIMKHIKNAIFNYRSVL